MPNPLAILLLLQLKVLLLGQLPAQLPGVQQASQLPPDLSGYAAIIVARNLTSSEVRELLEYIASGGCVLLLADVKTVPELGVNMTLTVNSNSTPIPLTPLVPWATSLRVDGCMAVNTTAGWHPILVTSTACWADDGDSVKEWWEPYGTITVAAAMQKGASRLIAAGFTSETCPLEFLQAALEWLTEPYKCRMELQLALAEAAHPKARDAASLGLKLLEKGDVKMAWMLAEASKAISNATLALREARMLLAEATAAAAELSKLEQEASRLAARLESLEADISSLSLADPREASAEAGRLEAEARAALSSVKQLHSTLAQLALSKAVEQLAEARMQAEKAASLAEQLKQLGVEVDESKLSELQASIREAEEKASEAPLEALSKAKLLELKAEEQVKLMEATLAKAREAREAIARAEETIAKAREAGADTVAAEQQLKKAKEALRGGQLQDALNLAREAESRAEEAKMRAEERRAEGMKLAITAATAAASLAAIAATMSHVKSRRRVKTKAIEAIASAKQLVKEAEAALPRDPGYQSRLASARTKLVEAQALAEQKAWKQALERAEQARRVLRAALTKAARQAELKQMWAAALEKLRQQASATLDKLAKALKTGYNTPKLASLLTEIAPEIRKAQALYEQALYTELEITATQLSQLLEQAEQEAEKALEAERRYQAKAKPRLEELAYRAKLGEPVQLAEALQDFTPQEREWVLKHKIPREYPELLGKPKARLADFKAHLLEQLREKIAAEIAKGTTPHRIEVQATPKTEAERKALQELRQHLLEAHGIRTYLKGSKLITEGDLKQLLTTPLAKTP
ncbi:MAG: hypothetical protein DRN96_10040 [Thermoproteota archaeon]|nr:MAG: hypothetical protein DRN96_10040 [Candidatus Korarchaeota archaeon]